MDLRLLHSVQKVVKEVGREVVARRCVSEE
jgi:hypothetical protein